MILERETNIYNDSALAHALQTQDTKISVMQGEINAIISETEMTELLNGGKTMYSAMNDISVDVSGVHGTISSMQTTISGQGNQITSIFSNLTEISASIDGLSGRISSVSDDVSGVSSRVTDLSATVDGVSSSVTSLQNTLANDYSTTQQMNSAISQSASSITTSVSETYATKTQAQGYANSARDSANASTDEKLRGYVQTTTLSNYSTITQTSEAISTAVSHKVGDDEIISKINQSAEQVQIQASRVNIDADAIRLQASKLAWQSDYSSMTEDGELTAKEAVFNTTGYTNNSIIEQRIGTFEITEESGEFNNIGSKQSVRGIQISREDGGSYDNSIVMTPASRYNSRAGIFAKKELFIGAGADGSSGFSTMRLDAGYNQFAVRDSSGTGYTIDMTPQGNVSSGISVGYRTSSGGNTGLKLVGTNSYGIDVTIRGTLTASGKNALVETKNFGNRLTYCYETASPMFGDIGGGITDDNGECIVSIDEILEETIRTDIDYYVFLQKEGDGDLYIDEKKRDYFVVRGTPNLPFAWHLYGKRIDYEMDRLETYEQRQESYNLSDWQLEEAIKGLETVESFINEQEDLLYETA